MVVDLETFGLQRLEVVDLSLGLELQLLARRELVTRCDPDHVAVLAHVQALGLQDDVERLIPGNILQAQGQVALHRVGRDDVEVGEVGDDLQHRTHIDVLEVQRQLLTLELPAGALDELARILDDTLDLEHKTVLALVSVVLPQPVRGHRQAHAVADLLRRHRGDRCCKVGDIRAATQVLGQRGLQEVHHQIAALLADVDAGIGAGQVDDDAAIAFGTAAEVDVAHGEPTRGDRARIGEVALGLGDHRVLCKLRGRRRDGDDEVTPLHARLVGTHLDEVEHQPGAIARLHDIGAAQIALLDALQVAAQRISGAGEVERDPGRIGDAEARRRHRERFAQSQANVDRAALFGDLQAFDLVGKNLRLLGVLRKRDRHRGDACKNGCKQQHSNTVSHFPASCRSCNVSGVIRSTQSP